MKRILFIAFICIVTNNLFAQIYQADNGLSTSGTGTATKVSLGGSLTGNTTLTMGANNLIFNSTTGHIGIRTATPQAPLHIYKNTGGNYNPILFLEDGLADGYVMLAFKGTGRQYHIGTGNASEPHFGVSNKFFLWDQNASSMRMVLDANGNFGFGTVSPANRISVNSATANTSGLQLMQLTSASPVAAGNGKMLSVDATGNVILVNAVSSGGWSTAGNTSGGSAFLGTTDASPLIFKTNNTEQMVLNSMGGLVLGTTEPNLTAKLDVGGIVRFNSHFRVGNFAFTQGVNVPEFVNLHQGIRVDNNNTEFSTVRFQSSFHGSLESNWVFEGSLTSTRDFFDNASVVRIKQGWGSPSFVSGKEVATLLIDPEINNISPRTYIARGIYYKPNLENITGVSLIAIENTHGQNRFNSLGGNTLIGTAEDNGDKLQVNGRISATGFKMPTGASPGYVLTSDVNGNATWQAGGGGGGGGQSWSITGNTLANVQAFGTLNNFDLPIITNSQERIRITSGGDVGINTNAPSARLHVNGNSLLDGNLALGAAFNTANAYGRTLNFDGAGNTDPLWLARYNRGSDQSELHMNIGDDGAGNDKLVIGYTSHLDGLWKAQYTFQSDGKLGIGTNVPLSGNYRLFVEDGIRTRKVKVDPGTWPDYVFDKDYSLLSLPMLEAFIRDHHHLPDMPSATEVKKEGLDLGGNQAMLLRKIEELSLHLIEQDKQLKAQQKMIEQLVKTLEQKK